MFNSVERFDFKELEDLSIERISELTQEYEPTARKLMEEIHSNPELGGLEFETTKKIAEYIRQLFPNNPHLEIYEGVWQVEDPQAREKRGTGVIVVLNGSREGPTVLLRADIDALPIQEKTNLSYSSQKEGIMHACGHDFHTAMLLGSLAVLTRLREEEKLPGNVIFVFQPNEERAVNPRSGAVAILRWLAERGFSDQIDSAIALHQQPRAPIGEIWTSIEQEKPFMAGSRREDIEILPKVEIDPQNPFGQPNPLAIAGEIAWQIDTRSGYNPSQSSPEFSPTLLVPTFISSLTPQRPLTYNSLPNETSLFCKVQTGSEDEQEKAKQHLEEKVKEAFDQFLESFFPNPEDRHRFQLEVRSSGDEVEIQLIGGGGHAISRAKNPNLVAFAGHLAWLVNQEFNSPTGRERYGLFIAPVRIFSRFFESQWFEAQRIGCTERLAKADYREIRFKIPKMIEEISNAVVSLGKADKEIDVNTKVIPGTRPVFTHPALVEILSSVLPFLGDFKVTSRSYPAGEDFCFYRWMLRSKAAPRVREIPTFYAMIGSANPERGFSLGESHRPEFKIDPQVIGIGIKIYALLALMALEKGKEYWQKIQQEINRT